jgi:hypothetical protein
VAQKVRRVMHQKYSTPRECVDCQAHPLFMSTVGTWIVLLCSIAAQGHCRTHATMYRLHAIPSLHVISQDLLPLETLVQTSKLRTVPAARLLQVHGSA